MRRDEKIGRIRAGKSRSYFIDELQRLYGLFLAVLLRFCQSLTSCKEIEDIIIVNIHCSALYVHLNLI